MEQGALGMRRAWTCSHYWRAQNGPCEKEHSGTGMQLSGRELASSQYHKQNQKSSATAQIGKQTPLMHPGSEVQDEKAQGSRSLREDTTHISLCPAVSLSLGKWQSREVQALAQGQG